MPLRWFAYNESKQNVSSIWRSQATCCAPQDPKNVCLLEWTRWHLEDAKNALLTRLATRSVFSSRVLCRTSWLKLYDLYFMNFLISLQCRTLFKIWISTLMAQFPHQTSIAVGVASVCSTQKKEEKLSGRPEMMHMVHSSIAPRPSISSGLHIWTLSSETNISDRQRSWQFVDYKVYSINIVY